MRNANDAKQLARMKALSCRTSEMLKRGLLSPCCARSLQVINQCGKHGGTTANAFGVFAVTYSLTRDVSKFWVRNGEDDLYNETIGATVAGCMQGIARQKKKHMQRTRRGSAAWKAGR